MSAAIANDLRLLAGQLLMTGITGTELDAATAQWLQQNGIRAVCLRAENIGDKAQLGRLTSALQRVLGPQALIAIDTAGAAPVYPAWLPLPPTAMALCAEGDASLAYGSGACVARALRSLGINWHLAPLLNLAPAGIMPAAPGAEHAFGGDPTHASAMAMAWMAGSQSEGVACCARLFMPSAALPDAQNQPIPQNAPTAALPTVDKSRSQLEEYDFVPFRQATLQAASMMSAHVLYPALDAELPASLSPRVMHGLVREQWQFDGVIISDGLDTGSVRARHATGEIAVRSVAAGSDMAMVLETPAAVAALDGLAAALASGSVPLQAAGARLARLAAQAQRYPAKAEPHMQHYLQEAADRIILAEGWRRCRAALARQQQ